MAYVYIRHTGCSSPTEDPYCPQFPPPPPPYSDADNGTRIQIRGHHPNSLTISFLIAAGSLLGLSFLLLLVFAAVLRRRRRLRRQLRSTPPPEPETDGGEGDTDTHHVWFIRTVGLDESIIASIASAEYKSGVGGEAEGDCAVCLGEFVDGEMVKLLPKCAHTFHVSCVDTWLRAHVNCPVCRAPVLPAEPTAADTVQLDISDSDSPATSQSATSTVSSSAVDSEEKGFQPVRRSVSVDSSTLDALLLRIELQQRALFSDFSSRGKEGNGLPALAMKRSQSTRSGRFFFARGARSRSHSILPFGEELLNFACNN